MLLIITTAVKFSFLCFNYRLLLWGLGSVWTLWALSGRLLLHSWYTKSIIQRVQCLCAVKPTFTAKMWPKCATFPGVNFQNPDGNFSTGVGGACPKGSYCPEGTSLPMPCPPGTFSTRCVGQNITHTIIPWTCKCLCAFVFTFVWLQSSSGGHLWL